MSPLAVVTSKTGSQNGQPHVYLADATGKKVAAIWGAWDRKFELAHQLAASPDMLTVLRTTADNIRSLGPAGALPTPYRGWLAEVDAAIAKAEGR